MITKRFVLLVGTFAVTVLIVTNTRTWVSGTVNDAVLQSAHVSASGSKAAPILLSSVLVGSAAIFAAVTTGHIARWIAAIVALLAGGTALFETMLAVHNPGASLRDVATSITGHIGNQQVAGSLTIWVWFAVFGSVLLIFAGVLAILGAHTWDGLPTKYDAPVTKRSKRVSDWDLLSKGEDPTEREKQFDTIK